MEQAAADTVVQGGPMEVVHTDHVLDHVPQEAQALNGLGMVVMVVLAVAVEALEDM
jgi:hypothetical protein